MLESLFTNLKSSVIILASLLSYVCYLIIVNFIKLPSWYCYLAGLSCIHCSVFVIFLTKEKKLLSTDLKIGKSDISAENAVSHLRPRNGPWC